VGEAEAPEDAEGHDHLAGVLTGESVEEVLGRAPKDVVLQEELLVPNGELDHLGPVLDQPCVENVLASVRAGGRQVQAVCLGERGKRVHLAEHGVVVNEAGTLPGTKRSHFLDYEKQRKEEKLEEKERKRKKKIRLKEREKGQRNCREVKEGERWLTGLLVDSVVKIGVEPCLVDEGRCVEGRGLHPEEVQRDALHVDTEPNGGELVGLGENWERKQQRVGCGGDGFQGDVEVPRLTGQHHAVPGADLHVPAR